MRKDSELIASGKLLYAVGVVYRKRHKTVECPSVCPVDRQQQRRQAGLLLRSGAGSRHRSIAAAAARHAGGMFRL